MKRRRARRQENVPPEPVKAQLSGIAFQGPALARLDGQVLFADYGIPGETVQVLVEERAKDYLAGRVVEVLVPSPHRVEPPCPYFGRCGGCQWQHIAYDYQLELKTQTIRDQFRRIAKLPEAPVRPTLPSPRPWYYRNHDRFSVNRAGEIGFVTRRTHHFIRIDHCRISDERINAVLADLQGKCRGLRQVEVRVGVNTGQVLISPRLDGIETSFPSGQPWYEEELLGRRFRVSTASFFQVNTGTAALLVDLVQEALALQGTETVIDAYAGVGTFACFLAERAERVIAIEEAPAAIQDAAVNVERSGLRNVELRRGRVEHLLPEVESRIEALVLDPPRSGCDRRVLRTILEHRSERIAYVSCDPATLARDIRVLVEGGYRLEWVQPVDQFPQTYHIEAVACLRRHST